MKRERADLLPAGALVVACLLAELELDGLLVSDWGLREGVILEAVALASSRRRAGHEPL
jgi:exopolyphosphatase/pppGpp-phosphohydrolase